MEKKQEKALREQLVWLLRGGGAHGDLDSIIADLPADLQGKKPKGLPYTLWQLLEHMRRAQRDILDFSRDPKHISPDWPDGYWPETAAPPDEEAWEASVADFQADLEAMQSMVADPKSDLFTPFAHGQGQTLLREALLVADHNAYHLGQMVAVRRVLGAWEG